MTDQEFCRIYSAYYGDGIDKIGQLVQTTMDGEELKELIEFFIKELKTNNMEFKGTKGKWEILKHDIEKQWFNVSSDKGIIARSFYGDSEPIVTQQEANANALLISKAPEMLDMLNHLHGRIDFSWDAWGTREGFEMSNKIEQLIKEATELKSE